VSPAIASVSTSQKGHFLKKLSGIFAIQGAGEPPKLILILEMDIKLIFYGVKIENA